MDNMINMKESLQIYLVRFYILQMDALFGVPVFNYSVLDTMNVHTL